MGGNEKHMCFAIVCFLFPWRSNRGFIELATARALQEWQGASRKKKKKGVLSGSSQ